MAQCTKEGAFIVGHKGRIFFFYCVGAQRGEGAAITFWNHKGDITIVWGHKTLHYYCGTQRRQNYFKVGTRGELLMCRGTKRGPSTVRVTITV